MGKTLQRAKREGRTPIHPYARLPTGIPVLKEGFHDSLDNIEEEIVRAKAVLHRDLEKLQAKRAAAEPKPLPVLTPPLEPLPNEIPSVPISIMHPAEEVSLDQFGRDSTSESTLDRLQKSIGSVQEILKSPKTAPKELSSTKEAGNSSNQTTTPSNRILPDESLFESPSVPKGQAENQSSEEVKKLGSVAEEDKARNGNTQDLNLSKPNNEVSNANSTDIDSLFGTNNSNENDNIDFADIDFTAGDDFTFQESTTAQNNSDLDALMPGIESYANVNQSDDFNMLDFPHNTDSAKGIGNANTDTAIDDLFDFPDDNNAGSGNVEGNTSNNNELGISAESNFDDLLDDMDFPDADDGTGERTMEHGEFDEAFFGLT